MKTQEKFRPPPSLDNGAINELVHTNHKIHKKNRAFDTYEELLQIKRIKAKNDLALRPMFFNLGMVLSILMAIVAINWKVYDDGELVDLGQLETDVNEIIEIPISNQPPPPPPKQEVFKIAEVKDTEIVEELEITLDVDITADESLEEIVFTEPVEEEEKVDEIFVIVEQEPKPQGGLEAFYNYLARELRYPPAATRLGISGTVYIQFVIEKDGTITNVKVAKGIGAGCDEEAIRVIENAPDWIPGKQRGVLVRVKKVIPIRFALEKE
ncbi:MAG: energy transducer TonB [Ekhidna sp.]|uniref:energy transducer TonB n=1 Tax=Ekhidna sp. TaxID=2608089 RepID=UPI0032ECCA08